jgi:hypothetical protein
MVDNNRNGIPDEFEGSGGPPSLADYTGLAGAGVGRGEDPVLYWNVPVGVPFSLAEIDAGAPANGRKPQTFKYLRVADANAYLYSTAKNDPQAYNSVVSLMVQSGMIPPDASGLDIQRAWGRAVAASADASAAGTELSPFDAIGLLGGGAGAGDSGPRNGTFNSAINNTSTDTNTRRQVDLSSASEARAFLLAAAERELGRAATADEIAAFRRALNAEERANPETTVTKSTSKETGTASSTYVDGIETASSRNTNSTSSSDATSTGGMDRGQYALDYARSADDYAEYTVATKYMDTLFAALQSPVDVGTN